MEEIEVFLRLAFMGLGLILTALSLAAWHSTRESKVMLASLGFGTLAAEGLLLALGVFWAEIEQYNTVMALAGMNFLAMLFLYFSILKR